MKRYFGFIIATFLLAGTVFLHGCTGPETQIGDTDETADKERIGIISAMDNEIAVLLEEADIERVDTIAGVKYHVGTLHGRDIVITRAGIGKVRSSSGVTCMLNKYNISMVLFTGIAGGVRDELQVLDEIIATRLVEHDYGMITNEGFVWGSGDMGISQQPGEYYYCDPVLVDLAWQAAVDVVGAEHVHKGTIATGDQFIASESYVEKLKNDYDAYACEMEGASIAAVCLQFEKPFVVIRCLSDKADGNAHESYGNFGDIASANSSRILLKLLDSLK